MREDRDFIHPKSATQGREQHKSERDSQIFVDGLIIGYKTSFVVILFVRDCYDFINNLNWES